MISKSVVTAGLAWILLAASGFAQTAAQLLQKGIYAQETAGDLDGAIQTYRQVIGSAGGQRALAAQAQFKLTEALLQKGDMPEAGREFGILARDYADNGQLVDSMAERVHIIAQKGPALLLGTFQNGRYHHNGTGIEITVPTDWRFVSQKAQPDGWDRVDLADSGGQAVSAFVVMRRDASSAGNTGLEAQQARLLNDERALMGNPSPQARAQLLADRVAMLQYQAQSASRSATPAANANDTLQQRLQMKLGQRGEGDGFFNYKYRPESTQSRTVSGHPALTAVADYTDERGVKMMEYLFWVQAERCRASGSVRVPASAFAGVQPRFEAVVNLLTIP